MANFMKVGDVAAELRVSEQAVRLWCRTGVLPAMRPAGTKKWLIDPEQFDAWLHNAPVKSAVESLTADYRDRRPDNDLAEEFFARREELNAEEDEAAAIDT
ncbi:MAG: helix-turn-helix domain-containing protein [Acidimicrobiales bacterium]